MARGEILSPPKISSPAANSRLREPIPGVENPPSRVREALPGVKNMPSRMREPLPDVETMPSRT